ncbi:MAG TPA: alkaline phosphatase family protein [Kofleriaceae bacterium]|nr:alkaline phosphatase family protein [Kofleriaceae bacterium]
MEIDRRQFLAGLGASLGAASISCGDNRAAALAPDAGAPDAAPRPPGDAAVTACTAGDDRSAAQLLAGIDTIVVLCLENRSFDHCLGALRLVEGRGDVDGLTGAESNPDREANPVTVHPIADFTASDPGHNWGACHKQWNHGANDGFVLAHAGAFQADVMGYHVRAQRPVSYALADAGVVCNRWFASCLAPTWPNRAYLHAATSAGMQKDLPMLFLWPTIWDRLAGAGLGGVNYFHDIAWVVGGFGQTTGLAPIEQFFTDAAAGTLPPLAVIDPAFTGDANDDHPTHDIHLAQALIASVVAALGASPQWNRCLFVLTYDEHGGFFDHVPPPALGPLVEPDPAFGSLGFRVPAVVVGPHVRRGCAVDTVLEHCSVLSTVSRRFDLAPINPRAAAAADLSSCIDPRRLSDPLPPPVLPVVEISGQALAARAALATHGRPELAAALAARPAAPGLDRRDQAHQVIRRVLEHGQRLGAVRIT